MDQVASSQPSLHGLSSMRLWNNATTSAKPWRRKQSSLGTLPWRRLATKCPRRGTGPIRSLASCLLHKSPAVAGCIGPICISFFASGFSRIAGRRPCTEEAKNPRSGQSVWRHAGRAPRGTGRSRRPMPPVDFISALLSLRSPRTSVGPSAWPNRLV